MSDCATASNRPGLCSLLALLTLLALPACPALAETVYRRRADDGTIIYSDQPGGERVRLPVAPPPPSPPVQRDTARTPQPPTPTPQSHYQSVTITRPEADSAAWYNDGQLQVSVATQPELQPGHSLVLYLDGARVAEGSTTDFQLTDIHRGTHRLEVGIYQRGTELQRSAPVSFHVLRPGIHMPQRPEPPTQPHKKDAGNP